MVCTKDMKYGCILNALLRIAYNLYNTGMIIMHLVYFFTLKVITLKLETNYHNSIRYKLEICALAQRPNKPKTECVIAMNL